METKRSLEHAAEFIKDNELRGRCQNSQYQQTNRTADRIPQRPDQRGGNRENKSDRISLIYRELRYI